MQKLSFKLQALLLLASMLLLSSCMVNHARIYEHAIKYDAVKVENPRTCYRHAGKLYLCGRQVKAHETRNSGHMGFKEAIVGPSRWETTMVPGTESQPVFREVEIDEKAIVFKSGSTLADREHPPGLAPHRQIRPQPHQTLPRVRLHQGLYALARQ